MKKTIRVVYDLYKLLPNGETNKVTIWDEVKFGKNNLEYDDNFDYQNNVEMFITQAMEDGIVYIGEGRYVLAHDIHGFYFNSEFLKDSSTKVELDKSEDLPKHNQFNKHGSGTARHFEKDDVVKNFGKYKKIRHKNRHNRHSSQPTQVTHGASNLPFNVENEKASGVETKATPEQKME